MILGAIEAGGTKMVCAIGDENGKIIDRVSIPTKTPEETMPEIIAYFKDKDVAAIGLACFGPIDLHKDSPTYGYITSTPKTAWLNYDIIGCLKKAFNNIPIGFDTDVNGSLLGEATWGCAKGMTDVIYITIGTGIGGGVMSGGKLLHGMLHPELGHILMRRYPEDSYVGKCPFHKDCFEGLAAGPAIEERWGSKAFDMADRDEVWELESKYIAQAIINYMMTLSPQKIILGGGVMHQEQLFPLIRQKVLEMNAGYIQTKELENIEEYIVPASLNDNQGIMGAIKLAIDAM